MGLAVGKIFDIVFVSSIVLLICFWIFLPQNYLLLIVFLLVILGYLLNLLFDLCIKTRANEFSSKDNLPKFNTLLGNLKLQADINPEIFARNLESFLILTGGYMEASLIMVVIGSSCAKKVLSYVKPSNRAGIYENLGEHKQIDRAGAYKILYDFTNEYKHKDIKEVDYERLKSDFVAQNDLITASDTSLSELVGVKKTLFIASLKDENRQIIAMILKHFSSNFTQEILGEFDELMRAGIVRDILQIKTTNPHVLGAIVTALNQKISQI